MTANDIKYPFKEYWFKLPFDGFDNYLMSNWGRIKSLNYNKTGVECLLKPHLYPTDYVSYTLSNTEHQKCTFRAGRLVAEKFLPNPDYLPQVNHRNEIRHENWVKLDEQGNVIDSNLEWCSAKYNINYGNRSKKAGFVLRNRPDQSTPVIQYSMDGDYINEYPSAAEAFRNVKNAYHIIACCRGKFKQSGGFIWKYKEGEAS